MANSALCESTSRIAITRPRREWAILVYDHRPGPFSASSDSGGILVDGQGRIGAMLTGSSAELDVLY